MELFRIETFFHYFFLFCGGSEEDRSFTVKAITQQSPKMGATNSKDVNVVGVETGRETN